MRRHKKHKPRGRIGGFWHTWAQREEGFAKGVRSSRMDRRRAWQEYMQEFLGGSPEEHWLFGGRRFKPWMSGKWGQTQSYNPFVAEVMSQGGGLLPLYVLFLISLEPRYGNDVMKAIEERTAGGWFSNPGAIYPLLNTLEESGFIKGEWEKPEKRSRRIYTISAEGQEELARLASVMLPMVAEAVEVLRAMHADMGTILDDEDDVDV